LPELRCFALPVHPSSVFLSTKGKNFGVPIINPAFCFGFF